MNSALAGLLSGVAGAANTYGTMQKEQHQYDLEQQKVSAELIRKQNFMQQTKREDYKYQPSGLVNKATGKPLSQEEASNAPAASTVSALEYKTGITETSKAKGKALADTEQEKKRLQIAGEKEATWQAHEAQKVAQTNKVRKDKSTKDQEAADRKYVEKMSAEVKSIAKTDEHKQGKGAEIVAALSLGEQQKDERFFNSPVYKEAIATKAISEEAKTIFEEQKGYFASRKAEKEETRKLLKRPRKGEDGKKVPGATDEQLNNVFAYLDYYGIFD